MQKAATEAQIALKVATFFQSMPRKDSQEIIRDCATIVQISATARKRLYCRHFAAASRGMGMRVGTRDIPPPPPHKIAWVPVGFVMFAAKLSDPSPQ